MPYGPTSQPRTWAIALFAIVLAGLFWYAITDRSSGPDVIHPVETAAAPPSTADLVEAERVRLNRVVDGDTLVVDLADGSTARVRLIGIDAPETHRGTECFGPEATATMAELVAPGDPLTLWIDPTQDQVDRYDRLLRFATTTAGADLGHQMLLRGVAEVYVYRRDFALVDDYRAAQSQARNADHGLWGACL